MVRFAELMSNIVAGKDVTGIAKEVTIDASQTDRRHEETHEVKSSGFTLAVMCLDRLLVCRIKPKSMI